MEQFLDMSFKELFEQYYNLIEALYRSYDRLQTIIDMVFPACVLRIIVCQYGFLIYIMTEAFYEIHYRKIMEEHKLQNTIHKQLKAIRKIYEVFLTYGMIKRKEFILKEPNEDKRIRINPYAKPKIEIHTPNVSYRIQLSNEIYDKAMWR